MKYVSNERGVMSVLVILLVVALVAAVGFGVYNFSQSQKGAQTGSASPSPSSATSPAASRTPAPETGAVFSLKELGIQFKLNSDIKDLMYVAETSNGRTVARFSTASLEAADRGVGGTSCTAANSAIGAVVFDAETRGGETAVKSINSKHVNYANPQAPCSQDSSVRSLAEKQVQGLLQALSTAQAVQ